MKKLLYSVCFLLALICFCFLIANRSEPSEKELLVDFILDKYGSYEGVWVLKIPWNLSNQNPPFDISSFQGKRFNIPPELSDNHASFPKFEVFLLNDGFTYYIRQYGDGKVPMFYGPFFWEK
jgi:hypothetical protein